MAPDKIYLNKYMIRHGMLYPAQYPADTPEFEYIRKDALLEWAKENEKRLGDLLTLNNQSLVIGGKLYAYQELIEKIESL